MASQELGDEILGWSTTPSVEAVLAEPMPAEVAPRPSAQVAVLLDGQGNIVGLAPQSPQPRPLYGAAMAMPRSEGPTVMRKTVITEYEVPAGHEHYLPHLMAADSQPTYAASQPQQAPRRGRQPKVRTGESGKKFTDSKLGELTVYAAGAILALEGAFFMHNGTLATPNSLSKSHISVLSVLDIF